MYVEGFVFGVMEGSLSLSLLAWICRGSSSCPRYHAYTFPLGEQLFFGSSSCPRYHAYTFPLGEQFMYILVLEGSENVSKMVPHASLRYAGYGAVEEESFV
jgi:hypothetical protein